MTVNNTIFHFWVTWKLSGDTSHQPSIYIFNERILIYNIRLNRNTCTLVCTWITFGLIWSYNRICGYMYHKFNLFATTIHVDVKKKKKTLVQFFFFYEIITANDMHIIFSDCSILFLDICWFLLTTKDVALWLAAHPRHSPAVDIGVSHPRSRL